MGQFYCGLDLGQTRDPSAFCSVERTLTADKTPTPVMTYAVRSLFRWPLRTAYPAIVADVCRFVSSPPLRGCALAVDQTGVGRPIVDLLHSARPTCSRLEPVTITAGSGENRSQQDKSFHVAKVVLISTVLSLLQSRRLWFAKSIPETPTLLRELEDYRVKVTLAANEVFNAREGAHDDLLLALALACWLGGRCGMPFSVASGGGFSTAIQSYDPAAAALGRPDPRMIRGY